MLQPQTDILSEMNFGTHKGLIFIDVARNHPKYITWALESGAIELSDEALDWFDKLVANLKRSGDY